MDSAASSLLEHFGLGSAAAGGDLEVISPVALDWLQVGATVQGP